MKGILLQVGKITVFSVFFENLLNSFHVILAGVFEVNQNVIKVYNEKNIKYFYQNFVDVTLKAGRNIKKIEKYNIVLKILISCLESYFLLVILSNSYLINNICQIQLIKMLSAIQTIEQLANQE